MRTSSIVKAAILVMLLPIAASASHYSDFYVLPVAAHTTGARGTFFVSDVSIQNFQSSPLLVQLLFVQSGEGNAENISDLVSTRLPDGSATIPAGGSLALRDVLDGFQGRSDGILGAILIRANLPFAVIGRNYTQFAGSTSGHAVPPARDFLDNLVGDTDPAMATAYIPGIVSNTAFRTNLGLLAGTAASAMNVEITLKGADGATLGTRTFTIPPASFRHLQFNVSTINAASLDIGAAEYRITSGDGAVTPYATVTDNVSGDSVFVGGVFPPSTAFAKRAADSVFRLLTDRFLSH